RSRHHRDSVASPPPETTTHITLLETNPCLVQYCMKGRECIVENNEPKCVCQRQCPPHHRPVDESSSTTSEDPNSEENEIDDESTDDKEDKGDLYYDREECSMQEYEVMKDNLLLYNHARLMSQDNHSKDYLVSIMFSHYDRNNNGNLEGPELNEISAQERLDTLSNGCSLGDMIQYDDTDHDGKLSINEFYVAFSKLYSVSVVSLDKALEVNQLSARVGDNVEIKCDVTGSPVPPIVWSRNNVNLATMNDEEVRVFGDGSLYLTRIQLQHAGNYTCHAQRNQDVVQTHVLTVHSEY
ncbi:unnamed protein product, partial [Acanthoscelides obtectus]